jgi:predicted enzyme related to lactoylglutathione lyase
MTKCLALHLIKQKFELMENNVLGIHHITAIAGHAKRNFEFYSKVLGLRFIKKTVNFDDPNIFIMVMKQDRQEPS